MSVDLSTYPEVLQRLLSERGISNRDDAERFLKPDYDRDTHDPSGLLGIDTAVARILQAIEKQEKITIFSDYDADGIPGAVVLSDYFRKRGYEKVDVYIPHRNREGFGLNKNAVDTLQQQGTQLLITIDCGSANADEVAHANRLGIEVIVTDHHQVPDRVPEAYAIVNPNQPGCTYPNKHLCGAGVVFKLVQALVKAESDQFAPGWEKWLLDMVGIATIADMVSLREPENRALASFGLVVLRKSRRPGIQQLCKKLRMQQRHLSEDDIGFMIGPRINAASRMDKPELAYRLLATTEVIEADELVRTLDKLNNERKGVVAAMTKEIKKKLAARDHMPEAIVIGDPSWLPSLVGLTANSLAEEYQRPVFVWGQDEKGTLKGSCRAPKGYDLFAIMSTAPKDTFIECGGHECSGGFSVTKDKVHTLEAVLSAQVTPLTADADSASLPAPELEPGASMWQVYRHVSALAPFGVENPKPVFAVTSRSSALRRFGKANEHLEVTCTHPNGEIIKAIQFFAPSSAERERRQWLGTLEYSRWGGREELRLRLV